MCKQTPNNQSKIKRKTCPLKATRQAELLLLKQRPFPKVKIVLLHKTHAKCLFSVLLTLLFAKKQKLSTVSFTVVLINTPSYHSRLFTAVCVHLLNEADCLRIIVVLVTTFSTLHFSYIVMQPTRKPAIRCTSL